MTAGRRQIDFRRVVLPGADREYELFRAAPSDPIGPMSMEGLVASRAQRTDPSLAGRASAVAVRADLSIPLGDRSINVRVYRHAQPIERPIILWLHGGAFVAGTLDDVDVVCASLATQAAATVVSLEYRLAPEHPYPAALDDTVATIGWLRQHGGVFGGNGQLTGGGQSSGATLIAGACLFARDRGLPTLDRQVLCYPWLEIDARTDREARSHDEWYASLYLGEQPPTPYAAPLRAPDVSGLPPAFVVVAGRDSLRDEAFLYATRLSDAAVDVTLVEYVDAPHAFLQFPAAMSLARRAVRDIAWDLTDFYGGLVTG